MSMTPSPVLLTSLWAMFVGKDPFASMNRDELTLGIDLQALACHQREEMTMKYLHLTAAIATTGFCPDRANAMSFSIGDTHDRATIKSACNHAGRTCGGGGYDCSLGAARNKQYRIESEPDDVSEPAGGSVLFGFLFLNNELVKAIIPSVYVDCGVPVGTLEPLEPAGIDLRHWTSLANRLVAIWA
jgi:hypothetical protein